MPYIKMLNHYVEIDSKELSFNFLSKSAISIKKWKSEFMDAENHYRYLKNNFHKGEE